MGGQTPIIPFPFSCHRHLKAVFSANLKRFDVAVILQRYDVAVIVQRFDVAVILQRFDVAVILQRFDVTVIAATSQMSQKLLLAEETESHPGGHFSRVQFIIKCCSG